jgi:hypothetical protein
MQVVFAAGVDPDVHVVGALSSIEEASQLEEMRFILRWAWHVQAMARRPAHLPPLPLPALPVATPVAAEGDEAAEVGP